MNSIVSTTIGKQHFVEATLIRGENVFAFYCSQLFSTRLHICAENAISTMCVHIVLNTLDFLALMSRLPVPKQKAVFKKR